MFFFFKDTATTEIYPYLHPLSLHDALPIYEPTNHMDIESIQWLEDFLKNNAKAVIVISHDKTFVDNLTNRTIEITMGRIYDYRTNYTHYLDRKSTRLHSRH